MTLGERIARLRRDQAQSLQEVADAIGTSKTHIWEIERHRATNPSMGLVQRLADHFGVSVTFLVGEDRESNDADPQIQRMFRQASELDPRERDLLDQMMQAMLKQQRDRRGG